MNAERTERLLRDMRDRAVLIESNEKLRDLNRAELEAVKERSIQRLEDLKKLYFNAGRWAGGARDWTAREAFETVNRGKNDRPRRKS